MRWLTPARSAVILLVLTLIVGAGNLVATNDEVRSSARATAASNTRLRKVAVTVSQLHAAEVSFCQDSNQSRAQQVALWQHLYSLGVNASTPPKARAADNQLIAYIRRAFAPRDCKAVYRIPRA